MSQLFAPGGQSIGASASASVLPVGIQGCFFFSIDWFDLLTIQGTLKSLLQHCTFIYIRKREKLWKDKSETDNGCLSGKRWREDSLDTLCYRVCIRKTSQSFSCVLPLLTHNAAPLTLLTLNVFFPPHQGLLQPQLSVPQLDSSLTLPTWRRIRPHRLKTQTHKTTPLITHTDINGKELILQVTHNFCPTWLQIRGSLSLGPGNLLEWLTDLRETHLPVYHIIRGRIKDTETLLCQQRSNLVRAVIFPVVMYACESWTIKKAAAAAAKSLQSCPTVQPRRRQPIRLPHLWDSPGKNTGVGCHFLLQCMQVESESEVAQSCPTLSDPWTAAHLAPPSMGFSRQEYWSGVPLPSPKES